MKYKPGDRVKIRHDLKVGAYYGGINVVEEMMEFCGKVVTIKNSFRRLSYTIKEATQYDFSWSEEMFMPLSPIKDIVKKVRRQRNEC